MQLEKATVKGFCGVSSRPIAVLAVALLLVMLSCIVGGVYANINNQPTLPHVSTTETHAISHLSLNEYEIETALRQSGRSSTANNLVVDSDPPKAGLIRPSVAGLGEWQTVRMRVTAYCPCRKCCGKYSDGITACGHEIRSGDAFVAAAKEYPFGTEMTIAGYNNGQPVKVLDRGGAICGNRLDVFFHSHEEALKWGVKYLDVKVRRK